MNYNTMTIAQLKAEIMNRTSGDTQPFNTKTRKDMLIEWLVKDDKSVALEREREEKLRADAIAQGKAFHSAPVVRKSNTIRVLQYAIQNGTNKLTVRQRRAVRKANKRDVALMARRMGDWS